LRRILPFIIVAVVALLTIGSAAVLYRSKSAAYVKAKKSSAVSTGGKSDATHIRGEKDAVVTLEEFGDFQCPPCARVAGDIDEMERHYRPRVRIWFRNFPLAMHAHAAEAAYAAEAAGRQGKFWEMHDVLYREQDQWSKATDVPALFNSYAGLLGLDVDRFRIDMKSPAVKDSVDADQRDGLTRGVTSTPTIFVNGVVLPPGSFNKEGLRTSIEAALKKSSSKTE
jgi:protein-disulfide isomerase